MPGIHSCIYIHTGSLEGVTLLEFEAKEGEVPPEVQPEEPEGEGPAADFPECPDHQPSILLKGKPRSIISLLLYKST
jgi:hypothetical protein